MKRRILLSLLILAGCATTLAGCWSKKELNELAVIVALGIDMHERGYEVSAQIVNPSEVGSHQRAVGRTPVVMYKATGATVPDALQRMLGIAPRLPYLSHLRVVVFGEQLARQGVSDALDYLARYHELRTDFFLLVAHGSTAASILDVMAPLEQIPANSLHSSILVSHRKWAATGKITLQQFIKVMTRAGSDPFMSGVRVHGDREAGDTTANTKKIAASANVQHTGIAVFRKDKLVGWLDESPSKTVNYVLNEVEMTSGFVPCPGEGVAGVDIIGSASDIQVSLDNGKPRFLVTVSTDINITAVQCAIDLSKPAVLDELEREMEEKFRLLIRGNIRKVQKQYGADIFGFGEALHRRYPKLWKQYRSDWNERFKTAEIDVQANVTFRQIGSIRQSIRREVEER